MILFTYICVYMYVYSCKCIGKGFEGRLTGVVMKTFYLHLTYIILLLKI